MGYSRVEDGRKGDQVDARRQEGNKELEGHLRERSHVFGNPLIRIIDLLRGLKGVVCLPAVVNLPQYGTRHGTKIT